MSIFLKLGLYKLKIKNPIGVFDSGLGGLITLKTLIKTLPDYDYIYFGDTAYLPYGDKSQKIIHQRTLKAVDFLFKKGCYLVILACHTAASQALGRIQKEYLPENYPERRVLGVTIPLCEATIENLSENLRVGILATKATCASGSFEKELRKLNSKIEVFCQPAPLLVPIIEEGRWNGKELELCLKEYLNPLIEKEISLLILGCTHYSLIKNKIKKILKSKIETISADEILPSKLKDYLRRHSEIEKKISKRKRRAYMRSIQGSAKAGSYFVTDFNSHLEEMAKRFFGRKIEIKLVDLN